MTGYVPRGVVREKRGWLFRWWKVLKCGAVYGHEYLAVAPQWSGRMLCECRHCGKHKVV